MPKYVDDMLFLWIILNVPLVVGYLVSLSKLRDEFCPPKAPEKYLAKRPWTGEARRPSNRKILIGDGLEWHRHLN